MAYGPTSIGGYMAISPATKEDIGGVKIGAGIDVAEDGTISINVSVDTVFPVGSIYLSGNNTSPAALFGGTWVKIAENRAIMGAGSTQSNAVYGRSSTVQPAALYINIWERVADDSKNLPTTGSSDERADGEQGEDAL